MNPISGLLGFFNAIYQKLGNASFLFILILIEFLFWLNGEAVFPNWNAQYKELIGVYLIMLIVFLLWARVRMLKQLNRPMKEAIVPFTFFFIGTGMVMMVLVLLGVYRPHSFNPDSFWQLIIIQTCVVALTEELCFRGVLLDFFRSRYYTGVVVSACFFFILGKRAYQKKLYKF